VMMTMIKQNDMAFRVTKDNPKFLGTIVGPSLGNNKYDKKKIVRFFQIS
jgi:hypothetical protein